MHFPPFKRFAFFLILASAAVAPVASLAASDAAAPAPAAPAPNAPVAQAPVKSAAPRSPVNVRSTHGAWSVICNTPAGAAEEQCALMQNVVAEDRPEIGLSVMVFKTADRKARILRVIAPLGVLLSTEKPLNGGLGLIIDNHSVGSINFIRCFSDGCYAESTLDDDLLKLFRNGTTAVFSVKESADEKTAIGIPVELKGFGEGYDALP